MGERQRTNALDFNKELSQRRVWLYISDAEVIWDPPAGPELSHGPMGPKSLNGKKKEKRKAGRKKEERNLQSRTAVVHQEKGSSHGLSLFENDLIALLLLILDAHSKKTFHPVFIPFVAWPKKLQVVLTVALPTVVGGVSVKKGFAAAEHGINPASSPNPPELFQDLFSTWNDSMLINWSTSVSAQSLIWCHKRNCVEREPETANNVNRVTC